MRLAYLSLALISLVPAYSQNHSLDKETNAAMLDVAAKEGVELPSKTTVRENVGVTAVLLTQPAVRRLFGKEIANTYAVVQLTISNRSADAAFVVHSAYIDTSQWALGGGTTGFIDRSRRRDRESWRSDSRPNRVASVESRIARGQLLDAQQWSARNWTIRLLTVAGSLASGYSFAFKEANVAKGIAAFNGNLVPGVAFAWPDGSIAQQNRISDFGYQTNKIIGKQSGDIIVCFFPMDMFLSSSLRQLFLTSPGLFLSPYQILFMPKMNAIWNALGISEEEQAQQTSVVSIKSLRALHPCYSKSLEAKRIPKEQKDKDKTLDLLQTTQRSIIEGCEAELTELKNREALKKLDYIGRFGLQNIGVYVDGIMTVDVNTVPASIDQVTFDGDASKPDFWAVPGEKKGTLQCRFCANGQVSILEADKLGIADIATTTDESDNRNLQFSFTTTKPIETGQTLTFIIIKKPSDSKEGSQEVKGAPYPYTVSYVEVTPSIENVVVANNKVSVTGNGFFNTKANPLSVFLRSDGEDEDVSVTLPDGQPPNNLTFDIPSSLAPGCWNVHVKIGSMETSAPDHKIPSPATPKLTEATRNGDSIEVKGEQLVDTSGCGGKALKFQLLRASPTNKEPKAIGVDHKLNSPTEAILNLPDDAKTGNWTVHVFQGTDDVSNTNLK